MTRAGFRVRWALETDDASDNQFAKICTIIGECRLGIHDISRTEADGDPQEPPRDGGQGTQRDTSDAGEALSV